MTSKSKILILKRISSLHRYIEHCNLRNNEPSKEDKELIDEYDALVEKYPDWHLEREGLLSNRAVIDNPSPPISGVKWKRNCGLPDNLLKYLKKKNKLK